MHTTPEVDFERPLQEWLDTIEGLVKQVEAWSAELGWETARGQTRLVEDRLGQYTAPSLRISAPFGSLILEPHLRFVYGASGRVDLYSYPSLDRVMLLRMPDRWKIRAEGGPTLPLEWTKAAFVELAKALVEG